MTGSGPSFADRTDFENAERGFVEALDPCIVTDAMAGWSGTSTRTPTWTPTARRR